MTELTTLTARAAVDLLRRGDVSPLELIDAAVARIEATDGDLNALSTLCIERARAHAKRIMDGAPNTSGRAPALGGLPIAVLTLTPTYSATTPSENNVAPKPNSRITMVDAQPRTSDPRSNSR